MKTRFISLLALLLFSRIVSAQVIDDSSINDAQNSGYAFVEGMFVAYLADTVSPGYIQKQFRTLDIAILDEYIKPMVITIVNSPSKESVEKLRNHPKVRAFYTAHSTYEKERLEEFLNSSSFSEDQKKELTDNAAPVEMFIVELDYSINIKALKKMMGEFRDVAYKIVSNQPRSVTLKAKPGNEPLLMDKVEQLSFVESTAMIGTIKN